MLSAATSPTPAARIDEIQQLLGHAWSSSTQVYLHPDPSRLRAAVDRVPGPRRDRRQRPMRAAVLPGLIGTVPDRTGIEAIDFAARLDPEFLAEAGWDPINLTLTLPPDHPVVRTPSLPGAGLQLHRADTHPDLHRMCLAAHPVRPDRSGHRTDPKEATGGSSNDAR